jgi:hypothetical protein
LAPDRVKKLIDDMEEEVNSIKKNAITYSWYMRGGVSYEDILNMSRFERDQIAKLVEQNMDTTKKSGLPFF